MGSGVGVEIIRRGDFGVECCKVPNQMGIVQHGWSDLPSLLPLLVWFGMQRLGVVQTMHLRQASRCSGSCSATCKSE